MTGMPDRRCRCGADHVRDLRLVELEPPVVRRRGRPRRFVPSRPIWAGICERCQLVRLFLYKPPEQLALLPAT